MPEATYAVVRTGGKQYRVEEGTTFLVERLTADEGATVALEPLLYAGGGESLFGKDLGRRATARSSPGSASRASRRVRGRDGTQEGPRLQPQRP